MKERLYLKELIDQGPVNWEYSLFNKTLKIGREKAFNELLKSNLLGRGGAAFPTSKKWSFVAGLDHVVLICNADEGEPGTFKDRYIMENNPALLIEAMLISAFIVNAEEIYIYIRGEYVTSIESIKKEIENAENVINKYNEEMKTQVKIKIIKGQGAYVCGDETSLINSIEGIRPNSRIKPPYPTQSGLFGKPTIVNNVETLCNLPLIIRDGGEYFSSLGTKGSNGTKLMSVSGRVKNPGVYEIEMGKITLRELIYDIAGGIKDDNQFKFVIPGGISTQLLVENEIDVNIDYNSLRKAGTALGSGAVIVADQTVDTIDLVRNISDFYSKETCGICFPCKEGNRQIHHMLNKIYKSQGKTTFMELIKEISETTNLSARCGLGQSAGNLIVSAMEKFREEFERCISEETSDNLSDIKIRSIE